MTATNPDITFCLKRIGKDTAGWDTLVVAGADTVTPPEDLWAAWSDLERWPLWSPLHRSVTGTPEAGWRPEDAWRSLEEGAGWPPQVAPRAAPRSGRTAWRYRYIWLTARDTRSAKPGVLADAHRS